MQGIIDILVGRVYVQGPIITCFPQRSRYGNIAQNNGGDIADDLLGSIICPECDFYVPLTGQSDISGNDPAVFKDGKQRIGRDAFYLKVSPFEKLILIGKRVLVNDLFVVKK